MALGLLPPGLLHGRLVPVERQGREATSTGGAATARRTGRARSGDEDAPSGPAGGGTGHQTGLGQGEGGLAAVVATTGSRGRTTNLMDPAGIHPLSGRSTGGRHGSPLPVGGEPLLVVPRQSTVADDPPVRKDELAQRGDVEAVRLELGLVLLVVILCTFHVVVVVVVIAHLIVRDILPLAILVVHVVFVHNLSILVLSTLGTTTLAAAQKLGVGLAKVIKHIELLLVDPPLVLELAMAGVDHVLLTAAPRLVDALAVQAVVSQLDLFLAVAQQTLEVDAVLHIGEEESVLLRHVRKGGLGAAVEGVVEEGLARVDGGGWVLSSTSGSGRFLRIFVRLVAIVHWLCLLGIAAIAILFIAGFLHLDGHGPRGRVLGLPPLLLASLLILFTVLLVLLLIVLSTLQMSGTGALLPLLPLLP